jgi:small-conductance mechanosensitive channel
MMEPKPIARGRKQRVNLSLFRFVRLFLVVAGLALATGSVAVAPARAQSETPTTATGQSLLDRQRAVIEELMKRGENLQRLVEQNATDDARLVELRLELEELATAFLGAGVEFRPRLNEINLRLDALGPAPGEDQPPEPEIVAEERAALVQEKAEINALLGRAESESLRVNRLIDRISAMRRDLFTDTLSKRYDIVAALSPGTLDDLVAEAHDLYRAFASWLRFVVTFKWQSVLIATLLALAAAGVILFVGNRFFSGMVEVEEDHPAPTYLSRLSVAFWSTLLPSASLAVFFGASYFFFDYFNVLRSDIAEMLSTFAQVAVIVFFVNRLARAALSPARADWRLLPVDSKSAFRLFWLAWMTAVINGLDVAMNKINQVMGSPLSLTIAKSLLATVIVGVLVTLIGLVRPARPDEDTPGPRRLRPLNYFFLVLGIGTTVAAILGYIGFARFLSKQIVITGAIGATMYIGFLSASAISREGAFIDTALGRFMRRRFLLEDISLDQLGLVASVCTNILIIAVGVPLILLQWGFQWGDITSWTYRLANEITIGSVSFSLIGILTGVLVFALGYFLTRGFQGWLDGSVLARGRVDAGVRNSIRTAVGYAGIAVAALIGVSAAGINLSNLALVAGALSLGIGFGLQNIVSNFVSGLILLAERPFKAGDWIEAGAVTGTVKRISVRATEIETFQRQTVILPNSDLINAAVGNWTHRNKLGRVEIRIGVAYGSDVKRVHDILLEIGRGHPLVLKNPEPFVFFADFGASSLDFELRLYLSDILSGLSVQNEIRFQIVEAFEREGIEIPFPQRDIHIKSGTGALGSAAPPAAAPGTATAAKDEPEAPPAGAEPAAKEIKPRRRRRRAVDPDS